MHRRLRYKSGFGDVFFKAGKMLGGTEKSAVLLDLAWERTLLYNNCQKGFVIVFFFLLIKFCKDTNVHSQDKGIVSLLLKGNCSFQGCMEKEND